MGGLIANGNYIRLSTGTGSPALYRINFVRNTSLIIRIVGEGNTSEADDYSIVCLHTGGNSLGIAHNSGPFGIKIYRDSDYNYYVYVTGWGYAIAYFANRAPRNNTISATKVDIDVSTLTQVGI